MTIARQTIEAIARRVLKPRVFEPVWQWAERNVRLSVRTTNTPGRYDSGWISYSRGWQEAFSNPRVHEVVICAAGQTSKTESVLNCIRYSIAEDPGPMLWIMPAESIARSFSETRLQPSLRDCPPCAAQIPKDQDAFKLLEMHFKDCTLNLVGANSPAQLASRPIRYLFADEIDKFPEQSTKEAGALELARVRTTSFWNSKTILTSTPTVEHGQIWQAYLHGTRHKYFVACPFCQHEQELVWPQVKWPHDERTKSGKEWDVDAIETLTYYECVSCRNHIEQSAQKAMVRNGKWKQTNAKAPCDRVSFHLNALYSPWRTWGSIAREFIEVKGSQSGLQNFTNSVLAEPWKVEIKGETVTEAQLLDLRADYLLGECPVRPLYLTCAADVQRESIYFTVRAWGEGEESWLLDYGQLPTLDSLSDVMFREYNIAGTEERMRPSKCLVDSGYNTQAVYEYCSASRGVIHPCKGWDKLAQPVKQAIVNYIPGSGLERSIRLYHFDDHLFKVELYIRRIQDKLGPRWNIPRNIGPDYVAQCTAEKLVDTTNKRGVQEKKWHQVMKDNHYGDCEKMQLVQGWLLGSKLRSATTAAETGQPEKETPEPVTQSKVGRPHFRQGFRNSWRKW